MSNKSGTTGEKLNALCSKCSATAQKDDPWGCNVPNPAAAQALCDCWLKGLPATKHWEIMSSQYNQCISTNQEAVPCIHGKISWPNQFGGEMRKNGDQHCFNKKVPGSANYNAYQVYLKALQAYAADFCADGDPKNMFTDANGVKWGAGGTYSHYDNNAGALRTVGHTHTSGDYLPTCGGKTDNMNNGMPCSDYCGDYEGCTGGTPATGRFGNGAWCATTAEGWGGSDTRGYGFAWMSDPKNAATVAADASFISANRGKTVGGPIPPGAGRYWDYSTSKGTSTNPPPSPPPPPPSGIVGGLSSLDPIPQAVPALGQLGKSDQTFGCVITATQKFIKPMTAAPVYIPSEDIDKVCGPKPTKPTNICCINSVNIGKGVQNITTNVDQSCNFTVACDPNSPCKGPDCPPCPKPTKPGDKDYCSKGGANCSGHGVCTNNKCICGIDRTGAQCELAAGAKKTGGPDLISKFNKLPERRKIGGYILIIVIAMILMAIVAFVASR